MIIFMVTALFASSAWSNDSFCKPLATLAKMCAEQRDLGVSRDALLRQLIIEGKLQAKDPSSEIAFNTAVWVYEENISAKSAYKKMYEKCNKSLAKQR